ncbi:BlaR1 family beta-lactam sensor/signal transducer [Jeotgalibacillus sp. R-1-5s-1]|uniref:BlaR1 family beta-lactam sensor/signal transducer n=1 Tax=Jeotgalibacillus sp. R-1-5s-1 TaxID=2555897 RepID=UPI001069F795|nr:BlaR1 family beta-lactam sensor/signal transducer [Jeotgalibacillus sp. R-1-5s-1]TFD93654.1 BlaR1 family beta-lactam sensor/signal transducer [Jeotgalibacillus sp. R-1-5s-1]
MILSQMLMTVGLSAITIAVIFLVRHFRLSASWRYHLWFLLIVTLTFPFLPKGWISFSTYINLRTETPVPFAPPEMPETNSGFNGNWTQDFGISVNQLDYSNFNTIFLIIWVAGIIIFSFCFFLSYLKLNQIVKTAQRVRNTAINALFESCKNDLDMKKNISLLVSSHIRSPLIFGFFKVTILIPKELEQKMSLKDLRYVILHELQHEKSYHTKFNYLFLLYQVLYWFNPFVWLAFKEMRLDRELACDDAVLHSLNDDSYKAYGHTILSCYERHPDFLTITNHLAGSKKQIKKRITHIALFSRNSSNRLIKSRILFVVTTLFIFMQLPLFTLASENEDYYDIKDQKVITEDLSSYFDKEDGTFVLTSLKDNRYRIYNEQKSRLRVPPNSTYKIYSALIGLEEKAITPNDSSFKWNGKTYDYQEWNRDQTLYSAMEYSVNWYFEILDGRIEQDKTAIYLDQFGYGNKDLSGGTGQYWLESTLKISPFEQAKLLRNLYTNEQNFNPVNIETVKSALTLEENSSSKLYGKTGTGVINGDTVNGWFIGFVETNDDTWFFATNIDTGGGSKAAEITLSILKDKGLY